MMNPDGPKLQPPSPALLASLLDVLGPKGFTTDHDIMQPWLTDWRGKYHGRAAAMLSPATTEEVAAVIKLAGDAGVADVVRLEPGDFIARLLDVVRDVLELADDPAIERAEEGLHGVGHLV